jgi:hypothetical protein
MALGEAALVAEGQVASEEIVPRTGTRRAMLIWPSAQFVGIIFRGHEIAHHPLAAAHRPAVQENQHLVNEGKGDGAAAHGTTESNRGVVSVRHRDHRPDAQR